MASESIAFFDGRYMPTTEAKISIVDPAVTKSDIVFDVVSATGRVFFRLTITSSGSRLPAEKSASSCQ